MTGRRAAAAVLLVALLVRAALLVAIWDTVGILEGDEKGYEQVARSLARGDGCLIQQGGCVEQELPGGGSVNALSIRKFLAFRAPLLPLVLAPVHLVTGGSPVALRLACIVLGALAAPLALLAARRLGGDRAGWIAGLAVALWPSHAWLSVRILSEPLDALLLLAAADLLLRRRFASGGVALGLAVLCRPGGLIAAAFAAAAAATVEEKGRRARAALVTLGILAAVVAPWLVRNWVHFGRPLFVTSGGVTILGGNCDAALEADHPGKWVSPEKAWRGEDPPDLGMHGWAVLGEGGSSRRFAAAAKGWVRENPGKAIRLAGWKVVRFLDPDTRSEKADAGLKALLGWLSWGPVLVLVAAALWLGRRERNPAWRIALALLAGHLAAAIVAYGDARMRAPVEPVLLALLVAPLVAAGVAKWTAARAPATVPA